MQNGLDCCQRPRKAAFNHTVEIFGAALPIREDRHRNNFCHSDLVTRLLGIVDSNKWIFFMVARVKVVAIVDDDPSMLSAADHLLGAHGFATIKFSSAEEFLGSEAATRADCLLLDIDLSGLSGIELRYRLKSSHPDLPIIFMTALDDETVRQEAVRAGCVTFLRKPFPALQLLKAIETAVAA